MRSQPRMKAFSKTSLMPGGQRHTRCVPGSRVCNLCGVGWLEDTVEITRKV